MCEKKVLKNKTREEVVDECVTACVGCWNHYSDEQITGGTFKNIRLALNNVLPLVIDSEDWRQAYQDRMDEDAEFEQRQAIQDQLDEDIENERKETER